MNIADIQLTIRGRLNELRALDRIVNSVEFLQCYRLDPNNPRMDRAIVEADIDAIREWMNDVIREEISEYSIRQLRVLAGQLGIKNYTGLLKDDLLILIVQKKNELSKAQDAACGMSHSGNGLKAVSG